MNERNESVNRLLVIDFLLVRIYIVNFSYKLPKCLLEFSLFSNRWQNGEIKLIPIILRFFNFFNLCCSVFTLCTVIQCRFKNGIQIHGRDALFSVSINLTNDFGKFYIFFCSLFHFQQYPVFTSLFSKLHDLYSVLRLFVIAPFQLVITKHWGLCQC